ncbi:MAG: hypothetical protein KDE69_13650, partial [Burkholderiaceae bacterium]|nr:hypothetical protein [Burkholderiaceae bacterium]
LAWLDFVVLAGRQAGIDVYTPCADAALAAISQALRDHVRAGRWSQALQRCADWRLRAANHAPSLQCQADRLEARIRALMLERPSSGVDVPNVRFGARALNKS